MIKTRSKKISLLLVLMMLATMFVGVGTASASGSITALTTPTISDGASETLGKIKVTIPAGTIASGDVVVISLPSDYTFNTAVGAAAVATDTDANTNEVIVPAHSSGDTDNGMLSGDFTVSATDDQITITAIDDPATNASYDTVFYIALDDIDATDASTGNAVVSFDGSSNTGFPLGDVTVGTLATEGDITLSASSLDTANSTFGFTLRIKESLAASFVDEAKSIKLKLPDGYEWTTATGALATTTVWGDSAVVVTATEDEDVLKLYPEVAGTTTDVSTEVSCWEVTLGFQVADDEEVTAGDIEVAISGDSTITNSTLKVGTYGDYSASVAAGDTIPTIIAGFQAQEIADIIVTEAIADTLQAGRTITLELPSNARWEAQVDATTADTFATDAGVSVASATFTGTDDRTIKYVLAGGSSGTDTAKLELENAEVQVEPGFTGDLVITVGGNAGVSGEITVAKVIAPVSIAVSSKTDVQIGQADQAVGDITITEANAGALEDGALTLVLPTGFTWSVVPTVTVEAGDIDMSSTVTKDGATLTMTVDSDSAVASSIKLVGGKITVDRTVPEGDFKVKVKGAASYDVTIGAGNTFPNATCAATTVLGRVTTTAGLQGAISNTAVFTFGASTYTLNGVEQTMDVAPYAKDNRTYMPIRYVAYALGIDDSNIIWDQVSSTVTLMKGDKVVQMKLGSTSISINGAVITMDVAPEAVSNRTMLPAALVAQAFGQTATWDAATNTVTIK